jgi:hypothetical protein
MPSTADLLKAALADRYRIEREIGHLWAARDFWPCPRLRSTYQE